MITHLGRMNIPISISRTSLFQIFGVLGAGISYLIQILLQHLCANSGDPE